MLLGVDVGGTFTDAALLSEAGLVTAKAPTTPADQSAGVIEAVEQALARAGARASDVDRFVHGMTVGTNALLEGRVARAALLATEGFTDLEELGRQQRAELYRLCAGHPPPLVPPELRIPVPERCGPGGPLRALDEEELRRRVAALAGDDLRGEAGESGRVQAAGRVEAAAVCLLWGFRHPEHERRVAELLEELRPGLHVSTSHETAGVFREYERCATTIVDAALSPLLRRYLERLAARARDHGLPDPEVMLSGGGVAAAEVAARHGSWTVLSGPAGGAVGGARLAARAGAPDAVCLDMGGTSCDVCVAHAGHVRESAGREVGGRALALPMVDVHTVGAGGGSVGWVDAGGALRVGPRSAGADPGPACYGRGGEEPTVTDAHLVLGRLDPGAPLAGGVRLDLAAAQRVVGDLARRLDQSPEEAAAGMLRVATAEMGRAVRVMTIERGIDPRELALVAFGGTGPLHATAIADELGMRRVVVPRASGVLSALGLVLSERRRDLVESVLLSGAGLTREAAGDAVARLAARGREELGEPDAELRASYDLRYAGQAFELTLPGPPEPDPGELRRSFDDAHAERYGYADAEAALELVSVRVAVALPGGRLPGKRPGGERAEQGVEGERVEGPALHPLPESMLFVPEGWAGETVQDGTIVLERT